MRIISNRNLNINPVQKTIIIFILISINKQYHQKYYKLIQMMAINKISKDKNKILIINKIKMKK